MTSGTPIRCGGCCCGGRASCAVGHLEALLDKALDTVGVRRFNQCRLPVRVVAFDVSSRRAVVLQEGALAPAIRASCSVPGLFQPVELDGRKYLDGGVTDRAGIGAASAGARVLFHHLPTDSPVAALHADQNTVPRRAALHLLHEPLLPRVSPFHLHRGQKAYELAREMTLRTLAGPG